MEKLARRLQRHKEFHVIGPEYKRPKGDVGELLNPWYNRKGVGIDAAFDFEGDVLSPELPKILAEQYTFLMPYYDLFRRFRTGPEENFSDRGILQNKQVTGADEAPVTCLCRRSGAGRFMFSHV